MGLGYLFPEQRFEDGDVLDPVVINQWLLDAADKYSGNLNEHAFVSGLFATEHSSLVADNCFGRANYTAVFGNPGYTDPTSPAPAFDGTGNEFIVPNHGAWEVIEDLTETITTGQCQLFIVANLNHFWQKFAELLRNSSAAVQFAIRIDGIIEDGTITGHTNMQYRTYMPLKASEERTEDSALPGPSIPRTEIIGGIGVGVGTTRLMATTPYLLSAGTHTVEVVARRALGKSVTYAYSDTDVVSIFTRTLFVFDIPWFAQVQATFSAATITPYEAEDVVLAARVNEDFDYMKDAYNDVQPGAAARGSFNFHQLPARTLLPPKQATITPSGLQTSANKFLSAVSTTIAATDTDDGWYLLNDGAGNDLQITDTFAVSGKNCAILLLANIQVRDIEGTGITRTDSPAAFVILYEIGGVVTMANAPVWSTNWWPGGSIFADPNNAVNEADVTIAVCLDFTTVAASGDVTNIGVYTAVTNTDSATVPTTSYQRGNLIAIPFRK